MVLQKNNKKFNVLPTEIETLKDVPLLLTVNIKPDGTLGVDNAQRASTISPVTPDPKHKTARRTPDPDTGKTFRTTSSKSN